MRQLTLHLPHSSFSQPLISNRKLFMKTFFQACCLALLLTLQVSTAFGAADPFFPQATCKDGIVSVTFMMATPDQHIYDDMLTCSLGQPIAKPEAHRDGDDRIIYGGLAEFKWALGDALTFTLDYQGCDASQCYMPQSRTFVIQDGRVTCPDFEPATTLPAEVPSIALPEIPVDIPNFTPVEPLPDVSEVTPDTPNEPTMRSCSGFIPAAEFVTFLRGDTAEMVTTEAPSFFDNPQAWVAVHGFWLLIGVVFLFGIALNLTPCVLPMMPINLAIIGAGAAGSSRWKGALRGGSYGLGIALAYGVLALIPVLTGTAFGTLQATWWFNGAIAVVFVFLALALFDVFMIDFTRFAGTSSGKQGTIAAFVAGAVSAILAGACVAPILIAVLLLTTDYVAAGAYWALCLPFVLGLGMAAPWPIAGAGLTFLPKPGAWMVWVKKIFAIIVLLFAAYYGWTAVKTVLPHEGLDGANLPEIEAAIEKAQASGKPVLLDFWGPACKACDQMESSTFTDPVVLEELARFDVLKIRMDLADKAIRPTQERFGIQGLPTFVVIDGQ